MSPLGEDKMLDLLPAEMARLVFDECGDDVERSPKMFDECVAYLDNILAQRRNELIKMDLLDQMIALGRELRDYCYRRGGKA
jgi:hypothetical protein